MRLAHLARDWLFVVGTPLGVIYLIARQVAFGIFLMAFFALSAYLVHRAAEHAQRASTGPATTRRPMALLILGQILVLMNVLWLILIPQLEFQLWLLIATVPPGAMAIVAWFRLGRKDDARVPR